MGPPTAAWKRVRLQKNLTTVEVAFWNFYSHIGSDFKENEKFDKNWPMKICGDYHQRPVKNFWCKTFYHKRSGRSGLLTFLLPWDPTLTKTKTIR